MTDEQTETDISKVLIEGDYATIMGVKYRRVEEPKKPETLYDIIVRWWGDAETQDKDPIIADLVHSIMDLKYNNVPEDADYD